MERVIDAGSRKRALGTSIRGCGGNIWSCGRLVQGNSHQRPQGAWSQPNSRKFDICEEDAIFGPRCSLLESTDSLHNCAALSEL
jgi:hypothetical protein